VRAVSAAQAAVRARRQHRESAHHTTNADAIEARAAEIKYREVTHDAAVAKVSIIGIGMRAHPGVAKTMFQTLSDKGINIQVISTSEIKVSVLIDEEYVELAVRALHSAYGLDAA